jgi:ornithine cyclodeaminase/alanine dehydrogenase-like protein (mu-crystallin family)
MRLPERSAPDRTRVSSYNECEMYLTEEQIRPVLRYETLIPAIRQALIDYSAGRVTQPPRSVMRVHTPEGSPSGWFAVMPVIAGEFMAVKTVTFFPENAKLGKHTHLAMIELLSRATGEPLAVMDGRLITEMRTAAVSAVAVSALAPEARTLGILGSGIQARAHIEALRHGIPAFRESGAVRIWSRNEAKAAAIAQEMAAEVTPIEQAAACDVVVTVTSATQPVLQGKWLAEQSLVIAVGAVGPELRELDDEVMRGCLIAESRQGAERESGDVLLSGAKVFAEIGEVLAGQARVPAGRKVFKSLGMGIEDLTGAVAVWQALKNGE